MEELVVQAQRQIVAIAPLQKKSIAEIRDDEKYRKSLIKVMVCGKANEGAHYGVVPGIKGNLVYKDGIQFLADAYYIGYGEPSLSKEPRTVTLSDGKVIEHFDVTAKIPIYNRVTGDVTTVGVGSCSTLETKYRYRGEERSCPKCGSNAIIQGKAEYGGGWLCYQKKGGCGAKFKADDHEITDQPIGKSENLNPADVLDTVISMAIKRARGRSTLEVTGMSRFFHLPPDVTDEGPDYDGSREHENESPENIRPPQQNATAKIDAEEARIFKQKLIERYGNPENVEAWMLQHTKNKFSDPEKLEIQAQLDKLVTAFIGERE
jgi:hypothetical protein